MFKQVLSYRICPQHPTELLNLVNLEKGNQQQRLVCALCEHQMAQNSSIIPLKVLLSGINKQENESSDGMNLLEVAMFLDRSHTESLKSISRLNESINQTIRILSDRVDKYYVSLKDQLKSFADRQVPTHIILDYLQTSCFDDGKLEGYIGYLIHKLIRQIISTYSFNVNGKATKLNIYKGVMDQCSTKLKELSEKVGEIHKEIETKSDLLKEQFQPIEIQSMTLGTIISELSFAFSQALKGANITISNNNLQAEQKGSESNGQRFAICEPSIPQHGKTIFGFKVKKYSGWVGVGVCHKKVITNAAFKFNYTNIGHGSYLISNNAYSWSHLQKELNSSHKSFDFGVGDIIYVCVDYNAKSITWKKNKTNTTYTMNIDTTQELSPCANLCSPGDVVEIINKVDIKF